MSNRQTRRRYRKSHDRHVWVFSELNRDLRPEVVAKIITSAGLEQARLEAAAHADQATRRSESSNEETGDA